MEQFTTEDYHFMEGYLRKNYHPNLVNEDLIQDCALRCCEKLHYFQPEKSKKTTWIVRQIKDVIWARQQQQEKDAIFSPMPDFAENLFANRVENEWPDHEDLHNTIREASQRLPLHQQAVIEGILANDEQSVRSHYKRSSGYDTVKSLAIKALKQEMGVN